MDFCFRCSKSALNTSFDLSIPGLETALWTSGPYAMDNALWTNWTADCMVQLGGCLSNTVGLGIDISFTETYAEAMAERESPWSVSWRFKKVDTKTTRKRRYFYEKSMVGRCEFPTLDSHLFRGHVKFSEGHLCKLLHLVIKKQCLFGLFCGVQVEFSSTGRLLFIPTQ